MFCCFGFPLLASDHRLLAGKKLEDRIIRNLKETQFKVNPQHPKRGLTINAND